MIELVDESATYELVHPSGAVFIMRHWTVGMQEEIDRRCITQDGDGKFTYNLPLEKEIKLASALADWRGVAVNGAEVPCSPENKKKLPVGVSLWLIRDVNERAGLSIPEPEKKS